MKIIVINGQNHKGTTHYIGSMLVDKINCEKEVKEYFLPKDLNHFCTGCLACLKERDKCPYWMDKEKIYQDMLEADLIVITSPNYCMMPSAPTKAFLDLFFTNWLSHKPIEEMFSKKAVVISTAAGVGAKNTTKLIANNLINWGIPEVYQFGIVINAANWEEMNNKKKTKVKKATSKIAKKLSKEKKPKVNLNAKIRFLLFRWIQKANFGASPFERKYWEDKGWLGKKRPWKEK